MNRLVRFANQVHALLKLCLSFRVRGRNWELMDYPVYIRRQEPDADPNFLTSRFELAEYLASIVNWPLSGTGDSEDEAIRSLGSTFISVKAERQAKGELLPRPGVRVPIGFASQDRINMHRELAEDFTHRVLGLEWAWMSDDSSLWDFHADNTNDAYCTRIRAIYEVDVSDIQSANLTEILERIAASRAAAN